MKTQITHRRRWIIFAVSLLVPAALTAAQEDFSADWWTIDGGGAMQSIGGNFELSGTIGQPDAGSMSGGDFTLTGGFWFPLALGDCNIDGGVDLIDYDDFEQCLTGPGSGVTIGCECFDVNRSDTVDLRDFAVAQTTFTGS